MAELYSGNELLAAQEAALAEEAAFLKQQEEEERKRQLQEEEAAKKKALGEKNRLKNLQEQLAALEEEIKPIQARVDKAYNEFYEAES